MLLWEKKAFLDGASLIIGLDEAGRGPLAGPVVAGAVALQQSPLKRFGLLPRFNARVDDSKKLLPRQRDMAFQEISSKSLFAVGAKDHKFIDKVNIYRATAAAMKEAVEALVRKYCSFNKKRKEDMQRKICVLVDGNIDLDIPYRTINIIKGDSKSLSIAAASIIAKVTRDRIMISYDRVFPRYGFSKHKGYGTRQHMEAIQLYGPCPIHRRTFAPIRQK